MKKLLIILTLLSLLFALAACSGETTEPEPEPDVGDAVPSVPLEDEEPSDEEDEPVENTGRIIDPDKPVIALTFDDGPNTGNSVTILDALEERGIVATYFVIGGNINNETAEIMKRAYELGCEYANHSWGWASMGRMEEEKIIESLTQTSDKIVEVLGEDARPRFFRAPNLDTTANMREVVKELGYPLMNGILGNDWEGSATPESIYNLVVPKVQDGSIILLHDGNSNDATAEGIGALLDALLEQGFQFVTLSELFEIKDVEIEAGKTYERVG